MSPTFRAPSCYFSPILEFAEANGSVAGSELPLNSISGKQARGGFVRVSGCTLRVLHGPAAVWLWSSGPDARSNVHQRISLSTATCGLGRPGRDPPSSWLFISLRRQS